MAESTWDPDQYQRYAAERRRPFDDLVAGLVPVPGGRVVDLGCGPGGLTIELHRAVRAGETVGIDDAEPMLASARALLDERRRDDPGLVGIRFERGRLEDFAPAAPVDLLFANASLQWVPDHPRLLAHLVAQVAPGGQLAFQVPANFDHPSHTVAHDLADAEGLDVRGAADTVLAPEVYATLLHELGLTGVDVRLQVYGFELASAAEVVEWTRGTLLTRYRAQLDPDTYERFVDTYRRRLVAELGDRRPYWYAFKRILAWARRPVA